MQSRNAWWKNLRSYGHWAFYVALSTQLTMFGCPPKKSDSRAPTTSEEICHVDGDFELDEELEKAELRCHGPSNAHLPVLYAHYLGHQSSEELCTEDSILEPGGAISCAPGPVLLQHGNSVDAREREWVLPSLPDYFAWHLNGRTSIDEMIYIANANGFPIKSQSIKLENEHDATLVLFPKTALSPGAKYYLYLVRTTKDATQRWIQPITMMVSN